MNSSTTCPWTLSFKECGDLSPKRHFHQVFVKSAVDSVISVMTDLFATLAAPTPSQPSAVTHFFRSSNSGRDSPRTLVAEGIFNLHIGTPPVQEDNSKPRTRLVSGGSKPASDPLFGISPTKKRSPRKHPPLLLSPVEEMDISEPSPASARSRSPPPPGISPDSNEEMTDIRLLDERSRYLRKKKRAEQIAAYRHRELKEDRESRIARRNNLLSPKSTKITKPCTKRVKFAT